MTNFEPSARAAARESLGAPVRRPKSSVRQRLITALKWLVTLGAFAFLLLRQPLSELLAAVRSVSPGAALLAAAVLCVAVSVGALRWRLLIIAYGALRTPPQRVLLYYNWVGFFYNTYLPGAVGGDVVRAIALKDVFGRDGTPQALAVVLIERVMGLAGLLTVISVAAMWFPLPGLALPTHVVALGPVAAAGAIAAVSFGRRLGVKLPGVLGRLFQVLPALAHPVPLLGAFALSIVNHTLIAVSGHCLVSAMSDVPTFGQSLLAVPLSSAAVFIPISVAGMGVRDTAFVALYELLGVDRAVALAGALSLLVCNLAAAALGGLWQLLRPLPDEVRQAAVDPSEAES